MNCPSCGLSIDEHPADRCLDAWVAEEVMGLEVYRSREDYLDAGCPHQYGCCLGSDGNNANMEGGD